MTQITIIAKDGTHYVDTGCPTRFAANGAVVSIASASVVETLVAAGRAVCGIASPATLVPEPAVEVFAESSTVKPVTWDDVEGSKANIAMLKAAAPGRNPLGVTLDELQAWLGSIRKGNAIYNAILKLKEDPA